MADLNLSERRLNASLAGSAGKVLVVGRDGKPIDWEAERLALLDEMMREDNSATLTLEYLPPPDVSIYSSSFRRTFPKIRRGNKYRTGIASPIGTPAVTVRGNARNKPCPCGCGRKAKRCEKVKP